jgi:2-octaprenyl-6-methoxyphenol hydroxylase
MTVCILGNGLAALTLAKALVNMNIDVELLTQNKNLSSSKTRTLGISKSNFNYFNKNIINIEKLIWKLKKIEIFTDNLKKEKILNFKDDNQLFSIIKNNKLIENLEKNLSKNIYFKKKIGNYKNLSFIKKYNLIINCDYGHALTKKYFSKKIVKKYNCFAYTTIIKHEKILNDRAIQIFTKKGPLAFLPISNTETSVVYSVDDTFDGKKDNIEKMIKIYNFKYKIKEITNIDKFELKSLNLRSYFHNNILAFGDLLHRIHPLAGQGFNMTIRDIKILTKIISNKRELGLPLDSLINDEFEKIAKYRNFIFTNGIDFIHEFFNIERKFKNNILSKSVQLLGNNDLIKKVFTKIADRGILL